DLVHVHDGETRVLFRIEGLPGWNDLCTDASGRVYAGALRFMVFDPDAEPVPGECWRVDAEGHATRLYGGVVHANGIALSPAEDRIYHSDTRAGVVHVHDLVDGEAVNPRRFEFDAGAPDGMAIDEAGGVWVASAGGGCVVRLTPEGDVDRRVEVPAQVVTSLCFGGPDRRELYVTTADNTDDPALRGCVLHTTVDVAGAPVHPARV
ncbi:MAG: SMP-30/gluconolactonase/LRE family protein, partial [Acidimicrobiia bacterium]